MSDPEKRRQLRPHGGYRKLRSFQVAEAIYDGTVAFCARFTSERSRTHDQMVQAARSGRQNIAEGSRASATSSQTELRLVGVARASLDELLLDYEDFLRQRRLPLRGKDHPEALRVRAMGDRASDRTDRSDPADQTACSPYRSAVEEASPEVSANTLIRLIHQANYLLDRQIQSLERGFIEGGGYPEILAAARIAHRRNMSDRSDLADPSHRPPTCPLCDGLMAVRTARQGENAGSQFWGCLAYPNCKGTRPVR